MSNQIPTEEYKFIQDILSYLNKNLGTRLKSLYVIGSLAHGGYSRHCSDIDLLIVLVDPIRNDDIRIVTQLPNSKFQNEHSFLERTSMFYTSLSNININSGQTRLPAYDKLDLTEHGLLIYGEDIKDKINTPSSNEILIEGIQSYFNAFDIKEVKQDILALDRLIQNKETKKLTKLILIPVRFLHSIYESSLPSCEHASKSFILRDNDKDKSNLINFALLLRKDILTLKDSYKLHNPSSCLMSIYREFFSTYQKKLLELNQLQLAAMCEQASKVFLKRKSFKSNSV